MKWPAVYWGQQPRAEVSSGQTMTADTNAHHAHAVLVTDESWPKIRKKYAATGVGGSDDLSTTNPPTRRCTTPAFPATRPSKLATLSSPITHLDIEKIEQACFRSSQSTGDASLRPKYRTARLKGQVILLVDACIQQI
jgi:hypothetical protein